MISLKIISLLAILLIPVIAVVIDACTDKKQILNVKHLRGAIIYSLAVAAPYLFFINAVSFYHLIIIPVLTRAAYFDTFLNILTGNPFTYNGYKLNKKRSLIDRVEDATGLSIFWLRVSYIVLHIGYSIYFLISYL